MYIIYYMKIAPQLNMELDMPKCATMTTGVTPN